MAVDPLAEVVTLLQPVAHSSKHVEFFGSWKVQRGGTGDPFYCAVIDGACRATVDNRPPFMLSAGDFLLVPALHELVMESLTASGYSLRMMPREIENGRYRVGTPDGEASLRIQLGHCQFKAPDAALLVSVLPRMVVVRNETRLVAVMQMLGNETQNQRPARELILERLLEILLIEALRCDGETATAPGLVHGLADVRLAAALRAFHSEPERSWTVSALATEAVLSRSAFFSRFSRLVGLPPMEYILNWRMALAKKLLRARILGIDQIAERVGYGSTSSFSVAFARHTGTTPGRFARCDL